MTSLKYFCEEAPEYHIIVAGSLFGVAVNKARFSFPVGKVDMKTLYPMDMEEFMLALGEEDLVCQIRECFQKDAPLPSALHDKAMLLYRQYLVVGGMPECVMQKRQDLPMTTSQFSFMRLFVFEGNRQYVWGTIVNDKEIVTFSSCKNHICKFLQGFKYNL